MPQPNNSPGHNPDYTHERIVSDAQFILGGAYIDNETNRLLVTPVQIEDVASRYAPITTRGAGQAALQESLKLQQAENINDPEPHELLAQASVSSRVPVILYSPNAVTAGKQLEEMATEVHNTVRFNSSIQDIVRPVTGMLQVLIPREWKIKKLLGELRIPQQEFSRPFEDYSIRYETEGLYRPGREASQVTEFSVTLKAMIKRSGKDKFGGATLSLGYDRSLLNALDISLHGLFADSYWGRQAKDTAIDSEILKFDRLGEFFHALGYSEISEGSFHVEIDREGAVRLQTEGWEKHGARRTIKRNLTYDPSVDGLIDDKIGGKTPVASSQQLVDAVQNAVALIPTMEQKY